MTMKKAKISAKVKKETYFDIFHEKYVDRVISNDEISKHFCIMKMGLSKECPKWHYRGIFNCYDCWNSPKGKWDDLPETY